MVIPETDFPEYIVGAESPEDALKMVQEEIINEGLEVPKMRVELLGVERVIET